MTLPFREGTGLSPMSFSDQHGSVVLDRLKYQRETGRFCDISLIVQEREFAAHRNILAACSPYFDSILKSTKITKEKVIVQCSSPPAFELFLSYMYSGCVVIDRSCVAELLMLANNFLVTKLKNYCSEYLDRHIDASNCISIKLLASKYNLPLLLKSCTDFFDSHISQCLLESVDILRYPMQNLVKIIEDPRYQDVISPDTHLKAIVRWVGEELSTREHYFRVLLASCDVAKVSESTLEFLLDYSPLFTKSQQNRFLMLHHMQMHNKSMDKYEQQLATLSQQIGGDDILQAGVYHEDEENESLFDHDMDEDEEEDSPVYGHPTTSQVLDTTYDDLSEKPKLRLKINLGGGDRPRGKVDKNRLYKKVLTASVKRRARVKQENDILPMMDDDDIDGVYASSRLEEGYVTYTDDDILDPDDVEDGEDTPVENGPHRCGFCKFATTLDEDLEKHRARVHNRNTVYLCQLCDFECLWSRSFYDHCRTVHWIQAPYQCDQCEYQTDSRIQDLLVHRLSHTDDRLFKCLDCGFKARTRTQLWSHEIMHSSLDERAIHCEECGRGFNTEPALDLHQRTHSDPRSCFCDECPFATNNPEHLNIHRRNHTGDIFYCHIDGCDYSSPKKSQLAAHLRTHMAVRAHMCKICGRGFIEKSHLVRHERIHLEDKPFKCDVCEYASSRRDKLKEHILKHHNNATPGSKSHRRRYRRARQLAAITAQARIAPPDAMFRPIPASESVSQWAESSASYQEPYGMPADSSSPGTSYEVSHLPPQHGMAMNNIGGNGYSPQRAYSVTHPSRSMHAVSPGSMSLVNVHLGGNDMMMDTHPNCESMTTPQLITPTPPNPNSVNDVFMDPGVNNMQAEIHRPMSLPTYGQQPQQHDQHHQWW